MKTSSSGVTPLPLLSLSRLVSALHFAVKLESFSFPPQSSANLCPESRSHTPNRPAVHLCASPLPLIPRSFTRSIQPFCVYPTGSPVPLSQLHSSHPGPFSGITTTLAATMLIQWRLHSICISSRTSYHATRCPESATSSATAGDPHESAATRIAKVIHKSPSSLVPH